MEFINIPVEFASLGSDIFKSLIVITVRYILQTDFTGDLKLIEHIALTHLVRMKLKTERSDADLLKSLINYIKRSLLLRCEKDFLVICKTVGDYRCDSLGFTCPRRAVKNEARTFSGTLDSCKLRTVRNDRQIDILFRNLCRSGKVFVIPFELTVDKALYDLILGDRIPVAVHVIPHNEL